MMNPVVWGRLAHRLTRYSVVFYKANIRLNSNTKSFLFYSRRFLDLKISCANVLLVDCTYRMTAWPAADLKNVLKTLKNVERT